MALVNRALRIEDGDSVDPAVALAELMVELVTVGSLIPIGNIKG
jgi:hypothetical protein